MSSNNKSSTTRSTTKGEPKRQHFDAIGPDLVTREPPTPRSNSTSTGTTGPSASPPAVVVPQNEFGGVLVTPEQIRAAFQFLDVDRRQRVTAENLRSRLSIFYDQLGTKDIKLLLNDQNELTEEYLHTLLLTNEVKDFDPMAEAFKAYDPEETGFISRDMLRFVFERLGYGALTDEDLNILVACADYDGDGRISLADFRTLLWQQQQ